MDTYIGKINISGTCHVVGYSLFNNDNWWRQPCRIAALKVVGSGTALDALHAALALGPKRTQSFQIETTGLVLFNGRQSNITVAPVVGGYHYQKIKYEEDGMYVAMMVTKNVSPKNEDGELVDEFIMSNDHTEEDFLTKFREHILDMVDVPIQPHWTKFIVDNFKRTNRLKPMFCTPNMELVSVKAAGIHLEQLIENSLKNGNLKIEGE